MWKSVIFLQWMLFYLIKSNHCTIVYHYDENEKINNLVNNSRKCRINDLDLNDDLFHLKTLIKQEYESSHEYHPYINHHHHYTEVKITNLEKNEHQSLSSLSYNSSLFHKNENKQNRAIILNDLANRAEQDFENREIILKMFYYPIKSDKPCVFDRGKLNNSNAIIDYYLDVLNKCIDYLIQNSFCQVDFQSNCHQQLVQRSIDELRKKFYCFKEIEIFDHLYGLFETNSNNKLNNQLIVQLVQVKSNASKLIHSKMLHVSLANDNRRTNSSNLINHDHGLIKVKIN